MTITQPKTRGIAVRRALLAILEARHAAGLPMPRHAAMAAALGISAGQVTRHISVLLDEGAFTARNAGARIRIEEIAV